MTMFSELVPEDRMERYAKRGSYEFWEQWHEHPPKDKDAFIHPLRKPGGVWHKCDCWSCRMNYEPKQ